jgi:uncharacterized cofD-like protein
MSATGICRADFVSSQPEASIAGRLRVLERSQAIGSVVGGERLKSTSPRPAAARASILAGMRTVEDLRVVAFGGGTGLPVLLRGLRDRVGDLAAVVTVADDGGSSGRLRQELGIAPPGDVRNCLVALAGRRGLAEVFNYRFDAPGDLNDHSVGNIIIAALSDMAGGFREGVEQAGRFLRIKGRVFPAATESLTLIVRHADGTITRGESVLREVGKKVESVAVEPEDAPAPPGVISAIEGADVVVMGPGSLFTSTIPALLGAGTREALARFSGPVVYVANVMTQPGETTGFSVSEHVRAVIEHVGPVITDVLVHSREVPKELAARYEAEGAAPATVDHDALETLGVRVSEADLLSDAFELGVRHDPARLAEEVCEAVLVRH